MRIAMLRGLNNALFWMWLYSGVLVLTECMRHGVMLKLAYAPVLKMGNVCITISIVQV